jgi:D-alanine-D-alanine ligase
MKKTNISIEIVSSTVNGLSSMSAASRDGIYDVLQKIYGDVRITIINSVDDLESLTDRRPDLVFLGMKYIISGSSEVDDIPQKIWLAQYLDENDITYTGSNYLAHKLELNKGLAKQRVIEHGINTSPFIVTSRKEDFITDTKGLRFPMFVKPLTLGGGAGIDEQSIVYDLLELNTKIDSIGRRLLSDSIVEEYLDGSEFSVAILKEPNLNRLSTMPLELVAPLNINGERFLSKEIKATDSEKFLPVLNPELNSELRKMAEDVFVALGARDYARIDIRLDKFGKLHFLEANLIPSLLNNYGNFTKACLVNLGMEYPNVITSIVDLALIRIDAERDKSFENGLSSSLATDVVGI